MMIAAVIAGWVVCGVLAYGLCYHHFQRHFGGPEAVKRIGEKRVRNAAGLLPHAVFLVGPAGLLISLIMGWPWGLQYRYKGVRT